MPKPRRSPKYRNLLPPLRSDEREALAADIALRGVLDAIILDANGDILDGHHRFDIDPKCRCRVLPGVKGMSQAAKEAWVLGFGDKRRNMTAEQKAGLAEARRQRAVKLRSEGMTQAEIAALLGVDHRTVGRWVEQIISNGHVPNTNTEADGEDGPEEAEQPEKVFDQRRKVSAAEKGVIWRKVKRDKQTQEQVAADHGITQGRVSQIIAATTKARRLLAAERRAKREAKGKPVVYQADAVDWLASQPACDLLLTDPPYMTELEDVGAFSEMWLPDALDKVKVTGRAYVCVGAYAEELWAYLSIEPPEHLVLANVLVWTYRNTLGPRPSHDYKLNWQAILYYRGMDAPPLNCERMTEQFTVQDVAAPDGRLGNKIHTWQKPAELAERLVLHATKPGNLVLDCFVGTGTFVLAAKRLGRKAVGCDNDPGMLALAEQEGCRIAK